MRILLCVAGMPYAKAAISFGRIVANVTRSPLTILHVVRQEESPENGERALAAAREMLQGLNVNTCIRQGDPIGMILVEVTRGNYDLLVIGAHQEAGFTQQVLGSVAQKVTRRVPTSVLIAREVGPSLARVLICTGGIAVADPVIEAGARLAGAARAQATLLHVASPVPSMYTGLDDITESLTELLQTDTPIARHLRQGAETLARYQVTAELELRRGVAAAEILRKAHRDKYDLIVIGASGTAGRLREWLLGNVTRQIVECAPCSVLVVKTEFPDA